MQSFPFDQVILTAANEQQAAGYREQLAWRRQHGHLPAESEFLVLADPGGKRIGSGGSTLVVLDHLLQQAAGDFSRAFNNRRILLMHSGGDSRRLPAYSPLGKLFAPLPTSRYRALFDVMVDTYQTLPALQDGQVIVVSGDVLLHFDARQIAFASQGITGVAYPDDPANGSRYGVYAVRQSPQAGQVLAVDDFLQKPDLDALQRAGAMDPGYRVWIDTGILNLAPDAVQRMLDCRELLDFYRRGERNDNLYHQILFAVMGKSDLPGGKPLHGIGFSVSLLHFCGFFHIGRSRELLQNYYTLTTAAALCNFRNSSRSNARLFPHLKNCFIFNTFIENSAIAAESPALIEGCILDSLIQLEGENLLTGLPAGCGPIRLSRGLGLALLPIGEHDWTAVLYGIDDSFKNDQQATFCNRPWSEMRSLFGLSDRQLWPAGVEQELWTARLFPRSLDPRIAVESALPLAEGRVDDPGAPRLSMQEVLAQVNQQRLLEQSAEISRRAAVALWQAGEADNDPASLEELLQLCRSPEDEEGIALGLSRLLSATNGFTRRAHLEYLLYMFVRRRAERSSNPAALRQAQEWQDRAFADIRSAVDAEVAHFDTRADCEKLRIRTDEVVWTVVPARLDFAGGWSDTPPVCFDLGGTVLNAAVTLNGQYPIQVIAKRNAEPVIRINSIDLGASAVIRGFAELFDFHDPTDWCSLPKSAFVASGLVPAEVDGDLRTFFTRFGGGVDLTLFSALPAGSGLGTSSILGAGIIATLGRLTGREIPRDELFARTSAMEQLMTTGGGWQDQIGGAAGGVKLIQTAPGYQQDPVLSWTTLVPPGVRPGDRFLLYYTGQRRMAKNILRQIIGRYLNRERQVLQTLDELKELALAMKEDLDHRRLDDFGAKIGAAWECNKRLDSGSTTPEIEAILDRVSTWTIGAKLLGAGGGGFLLLVTANGADAQRIRQNLEENPPNDRARFFDFNVDPYGIRTTVL